MSPCKGCTERSAECHAICEKYLKFRKECDRLRDDRNKQKQLENDANDWMKRVRK